MFHNFEFNIYSIKALSKIKVDNEIMKKILEVSEPRVIGYEEVVILQGNVGDNFYLILQGDCHATINQKVKNNKITK